MLKMELGCTNYKGTKFGTDLDKFELSLKCIRINKRKDKGEKPLWARSETKWPSCARDPATERPRARLEPGPSPLERRCGKKMRRGRLAC